MRLACGVREYVCVGFVGSVWRCRSVCKKRGVGCDALVVKWERGVNVWSVGERLGAGVEAGDAGEFGEEALFFGGEGMGDDDLNDGVEIAGRFVGHGGKAFAAEAHTGTGTGAGGDGNGGRGVHGADGDFSAEGGFPGGEQEIRFEVAAVEAEHGMRGDVNGKVEVAGSTSGYGLALAAEADAALITNATRDFDVESFVDGAAGEGIGNIERDGLMGTVVGVVEGDGDVVGEVFAAEGTRGAAT